MIKKYQNVLLCITSSFLLWLAWPPHLFTPLLFIAFVPFLFIADNLRKANTKNKHWKFFGLSYLTFFLWNIYTTYWIYLASPEGAVMAIVLNALFMCIPVCLYFFVHKTSGNYYGFLSLIAFWITYEFLHQRWDISWPWLVLGNGLSSWYKFVQWYEYTGVFGGTVWIWLINILTFLWLEKYIRERKFDLNSKWELGLILTAIVIPMFLSFIKYKNYQEKIAPYEVAVVQPNIDPYNEKFNVATGDNPNYIPKEIQIERMMQLSEKVITSNTRLLVWPETAFPESIEIKELMIDGLYSRATTLQDAHSDLGFLSGAMIYKEYDKGLKNPTATARKYKNVDIWYDMYNSAVYRNYQSNPSFYHKSRLVPGVEIMPYPAIFKILEPLAINLGGTLGSLGRQAECSIFYDKDSVGIAPIICYESIYGGYLTEFVQKGAALICIITNDGWWGNTPGYKHHVEYSRLRAIETRRSIARSANTGISCFINQRGDILEATPWWKPTSISMKLNLNSELTFYANHGDYLGRFSAFLSIFLLFSALITHFKKKKIDNEI